MPFACGEIHSFVSQNAEDMSFPWSKINNGLQEKIVKEVKESYSK